MMRVGSLFLFGGISLVASCSSTTKVTPEGAGGAAGADAGAGAAGGAGGAGGSTAGAGGATGGSSGSTGGSSTTGGTGGAAGAGGTGGTGGAAGGGCPDSTQVKGPSLVFVDGFCIDSTEVTNEQYEAFINAGVTTQQIAACTQNTSFVPSDGWPAATDEFQMPVAYVDWCDAYAYCSWAGKRLCGKIGGGSNSYEAYADENLSQWYRVCSNGGRNTYPYGGTYDGTKCNGFEGPDGCYPGTGSPTCSRVPVGSYTQCQGVGAYAGVYDLSGNLLEWEDACTTEPDGGASICRIRGGAIYAQGESDMACDTDTYNERLDNSAPGIGFRCCYN